MTKEVRIDLDSPSGPLVYVDGVLTRCILEVVYRDPPAPPLTLKGLELSVREEGR